MSKPMITPEKYFDQRRQLLQTAVKAGLLCTLPVSSVLRAEQLELTPEKNATRYNNYYEFSTNKKFVHIIAEEFTSHPWSLEISGLVKQPITLTMEQLPKSQQRVLRFRCVEGWSMTVPWQGFSLSELLSMVQPLEQAQYVRFESVFRPSEMIGQRTSSINWPYVEGLRLDEAMHPLTTIATGMYGKTLPKQNGAPLRLLVPWKYGFKSIKAIKKIDLVADQPVSSWQQLAPQEYGFYANVNPLVPHPRWSQRREVPLGQLRKVKTQPFNGYESQVKHLYEDMDLFKLF
jgi:sulfoxide reductase catalytic subunit YedY